MRKGQSAIEYLITYGWMVLAVAIVGGIAYNSVSGSCQRSFTGFYTDAVSIEQFGVDTQGNFRVSLENNRFSSIQVQRFNVSSESAERYKDLSVNVDPGSSQDLSVPGYSQAEGCTELDVRMVFDKGPLKNQVLTGTIRAPISVEEVTIPGAPISADATA